jgi:23S rRNA (cytidine1920-2'-O)/16S rRNA (cytidine1409-2'-O)-methyltransferase
LAVETRRLDTRLVENGLAISRNQAQALIMAGKVRVNGHVEMRPAARVGPDESVELAAGQRFVSRGGEKLDTALTAFGIDVKDKVVLDTGASTGGFTDCLLKRGARRVFAVDVGYNQLDYRLRSDPRVVSIERVNARYAFEIEEMADLVTLDLSFISLQKVLPNVLLHVRPPRAAVALFKPQFEAEKAEVGKGGIIRDPQVHTRVLGRFIAWLGQEGHRLRGLIASPITGSSGNREFLAYITDW